MAEHEPGGNYAAPRALEMAGSLGKTLFNPVLNGEVAERRWARDGLAWE